MKNNENNAILEIITQGSSLVTPLLDLENKINKKKSLVVKLGADPTAANLHLGHLVVLEKLRDLQNIGYHIYFLIGDFTARIGDPTGKSKTRPSLSTEEIEKNVLTYVEQISRVIDCTKIKIVYNSQWLDTLTSRDWISIASKITVARLLERDDFKKRYEGGSPIGFHELFYPLLQAYDSVHLHADIEIGGTDQTFNLLMGRFLQEEMGQEPQVIITMPLLVGTDGVQKMSKSLHNDIGLLDHPFDVCGKIMSLSDKVMKEYYQILLRMSDLDYDLLLKTKKLIDIKKNLAHNIIKKYWSEDDADKALINFNNLFQIKDYNNAPLFILKHNNYHIIDLVIFISNSLSRSEAKRLLLSGAIKINNEKIIDLNYIYYYKENDIIILGKYTIYKLAL